MNLTEEYAYLNWRMRQLDRAHNYAVMADGYKLAAIRLLDSLITDNVGHDADAVIFPVLFDAHQSLELCLKALIIVSSEAMGTSPWQVKICQTHALPKLINSLNSKLPADEQKLVKNDETKALFDLITLLESVGRDEEGGYYVDFARYPERDPSNQYIFVKDNSLVFHLPKLRDVIESGCEFLDGFYALWEDRTDSIRALSRSSLSTESQESPDGAC